MISIGYVANQNFSEQLKNIPFHKIEFNYQNIKVAQFGESLGPIWDFSLCTSWYNSSTGETFTLQSAKLVSPYSHLFTSS